MVSLSSYIQLQSKKEVTTDHDSATTTIDANNNALLLLLQKRRRGVLWRLTELGAKWKFVQETLLKVIATSFAEVEAPTVDKSSTTDKSNTNKKSQSKNSRQCMEYCIRQLLDVKMPQHDGEGRLSLNVNGVRTVYHLLHFVSRLCEGTLNALIQQFGTEEMECIAKDGLGSRWYLCGMVIRLLFMCIIFF